MSDPICNDTNHRFMACGENFNFCPRCGRPLSADAIAANTVMRFALKSAREDVEYLIHNHVCDDSQAEQMIQQSTAIALIDLAMKISEVPA